MDKIIMKTFLLTVVFLSAAMFSRAQNINNQLLAAVKTKNLPLVQLSLKSGADANAIEVTSNVRVSALILAVVTRDMDIVRVLVEHKAEVNWRDGFGDTALMYAAQTGDMAIIGYLLNNGADIHAKDLHGNTVLSAAREGNHPEAVKFIQSRL